MDGSPVHYSRRFGFTVTGLLGRHRNWNQQRLATRIEVVPATVTQALKHGKGPHDVVSKIGLEVGLSQHECDFYWTLQEIDRISKLSPQPDAVAQFQSDVAGDPDADPCDVFSRHSGYTWEQAAAVADFLLVNHCATWAQMFSVSIGYGLHLSDGTRKKDAERALNAAWLTTPLRFDAIVTLGQLKAEMDMALEAVSTLETVRELAGESLERSGNHMVLAYLKGLSAENRILLHLRIGTDINHGELYARLDQAREHVRRMDRERPWWGFRFEASQGYLKHQMGERDAGNEHLKNAEAGLRPLAGKSAAGTLKRIRIAQAVTALMKGTCADTNEARISAAAEGQSAMTARPEHRLLWTLLMNHLRPSMVKLNALLVDQRAHLIVTILVTVLGLILGSSGVVSALEGCH